MNKLIVDIEVLDHIEREALTLYLDENGIEYEEVALNPYEEEKDSGDVLSDSWLEKADDKTEREQS
jgi:hypothetical protein